MFANRYRYLFAAILSVYTYLNTEFCNLYDYFNLKIHWTLAFATTTIITFAILEGCRWLEIPIKKWIPPGENRIKFPIIFFIAGSVISTFFAIAAVYAVGYFLHQNSLNQLIIPFKLNLIYAWLVNLLFHLLNTIILYFEETKSSNLKAEELKRLNTQAELQLIKTQLNPHFLFNNLNVLSSLVMQNSSESNHFIDAFSKVYRYILNNHEKEMVPLNQEISHIDPYIFLLKKRFGEALIITIDIPATYNQALIIPAALQMLIENAIKHNIVSRSKPLHIRLNANGNNTIVVSNNLQLKNEVYYSSEIGLQNIVKRYKLVSVKDVLIENTKSEFIVTLPLITQQYEDRNN